jgi:hypothetical protein
MYLTLNLVGFLLKKGELACEVELAGGGGLEGTGFVEDGALHLGKSRA